MAQQKIRTSAIEVEYNGSKVSGHLCQPAGEGVSPGVVVIQEWWGLEPHVKDVAERFARAGLVALAPDLYHGTVTGEPDEAGKLMMELDQDRAVREITAAVTYLKSQPHSNGKVGTVGYCMGGGLSIATACATPELDAAINYYGVNPDPADRLANVRCPVLALYAGADDFVPISSASVLSEALEKNGVPYETHIYGGAPHAFFNDTHAAYRKEVADDAWERTLAFFRQHLG